MMMRSALYQTDKLRWIFSSLKQQFADRHVAPFGYIILIPRQPVFALSPWCCVLSGETTYNNVIVFGLTRSGLEHTIYRTRGEHANHQHVAKSIATCEKKSLHIINQNHIFSKNYCEVISGQILTISHQNIQNCLCLFAHYVYMSGFYLYII